MPEEPEESSFDLQRYLEVFRRRYPYFLISFLAGWLIVWAASWILPPKYKSSTLILVEQPTMPKYYVTPNVNEDLQGRMQNITQQILSRTRLLRIIGQLNLYRDSRHSRLTPDEKVEKMRKDIKIELVHGPQDQITAFNILYSVRDPKVAQQVTGELTKLFIDENLEVRQQQSEDTTKFLQSRLEAARQSLAEQEDRGRTHCSLVLVEAVRVTAPRPSGTRSSSKAIACCIAKRTSCWKSWQTPHWTATASNMWNCLPLCRFSSSMTWECRKLPLTAAEELLEIIMRRYERASTLITSKDPLKTGESCSVIVPPSPPCWIVFCTTDTFSNAARAAGEPRPAVREKANDKNNNNSNGKNKSDKDAGQRTPGGVATRDPRASHAGAYPRNTGRNTKPSDSQPSGPTAEGLDYRFLRSQPRVIGHGSLRKARPQQSETTISNTTSRAQS